MNRQASRQCSAGDRAPRNGGHGAGQGRDRTWRERAGACLGGGKVAGGGRRLQDPRKPTSRGRFPAGKSHHNVLRETRPVRGGAFLFNGMILSLRREWEAGFGSVAPHWRRGKDFADCQLCRLGRNRRLMGFAFRRCSNPLKLLQPPK